MNHEPVLPGRAFCGPKDLNCADTPTLWARTLQKLNHFRKG
jgi:hypothetical protein